MGHDAAALSRDEPTGEMEAQTVALDTRLDGITSTEEGLEHTPEVARWNARTGIRYGNLQLRPPSTMVHGQRDLHPRRVPTILQGIRQHILHTRPERCGIAEDRRKPAGQVTEIAAPG